MKNKGESGSGGAKRVPSCGGHPVSPGWVLSASASGLGAVMRLMQLVPWEPGAHGVVESCGFWGPCDWPSASQVFLLQP